jgi:hypothetical protein
MNHRYGLFFLSFFADFSGIYFCWPENIFFRKKRVKTRHFRLLFSLCSVRLPVIPILWLLFAYHGA